MNILALVRFKELIEHVWQRFKSDHQLSRPPGVFRGKDIDDAVSCALAVFGVGMLEWFRW